MNMTLERLHWFEISSTWCPTTPSVLLILDPDNQPSTRMPELLQPTYWTKYCIYSIHTQLTCISFHFGARVTESRYEWLELNWLSTIHKGEISGGLWYKTLRVVDLYRSKHAYKTENWNRYVSTAHVQDWRIVKGVSSIAAFGIIPSAYTIWPYYRQKKKKKKKMERSMHHRL